MGQGILNRWRREREENGKSEDQVKCTSEATSGREPPAWDQPQLELTWALATGQWVRVWTLRKEYLVSNCDYPLTQSGWPFLLNACCVPMPAQTRYWEMHDKCRHKLPAGRRRLDGEGVETWRGSNWRWGCLSWALEGARALSCTEGSGCWGATCPVQARSRDLGGLWLGVTAGKGRTLVQTEKVPAQGPLQAMLFTALLSTFHWDEGSKMKSSKVSSGFSSGRQVQNLTPEASLWATRWDA